MSGMSREVQGSTRREFLAAGAAGIAATCLPPAGATAQAAGAHVRKSLSDSSVASVLKSYEKAVAAMLALPPADPRNWYRNAFTHFFDCPHQNWWFLPWHRGYLGWFEQTCRELSGDPNFALPYWDWTRQPSLPPQFTGDTVLNPSNPAYIASLDDFQRALNRPMVEFFASLTPAQQGQLANRGLSGGASDLWSMFADPNNGLFYPPSQSRDPHFDPPTLAAVSIDTIESALQPTTFPDFGSAQAPNHSQSVGEGVLENQPHDNIHGAIGGFMSAFMSPIDPIFFMHHSNIDRLWDVWTRKQAKSGLPTFPTGADLDTWKAEPFLFFVDSSGKPATKTTAGDYAKIGDFHYSYQPGSGEEVVPSGAPPERPQVRSFASRLSRSLLDFQQPAQAHVSLPEDVLRTVGARRGTQLVARITLQMPRDRLGTRFHVLVNPPPNVRDVRFNNPSFAGTITPFGNHGHGHMAGPVEFTVPLTEAVKKLTAAGRLKPGDPLRVVVVPDTRGVTMTPFQAEVGSVKVEAR